MSHFLMAQFANVWWLPNSKWFSWEIHENKCTIWLFNIAMERSTIFKFGKPSISMGHLYHGYVTNNQMVNSARSVPSSAHQPGLFSSLRWLGFLLCSIPINHGQMNQVVPRTYHTFRSMISPLEKTPFRDFHRFSVWLAVSRYSIWRVVQSPD